MSRPYVMAHFRSGVEKNRRLGELFASPPSVPGRPLTPTDLDRDPQRLLTPQEAEEAIQAFERRCNERVAAL